MHPSPSFSIGVYEESLIESRTFFLISADFGRKFGHQNSSSSRSEPSYNSKPYKNNSIRNLSTDGLHANRALRLYVEW